MTKVFISQPMADKTEQEILEEEHDEFGLIVKIRETTRCYHPDD